MKLSALLLIVAAACTCGAQTIVQFQSPASSPNQNPNVGIVDDQALSRAATAVAAVAATKELQKMMDRLNQANCPVVLTSAGLTPYLMLLRTDSANNGGLDLEFHNASGKEIRSMEFSVEILVKESIYDLNSLRVHLHLTAYGTTGVDNAFAQLRHLSLPEQIHPTMVERVTLEEVNFADGSTWTSRNDSYCGFAPNQMLPVTR